MKKRTPTHPLRCGGFDEWVKAPNGHLHEQVMGAIAPRLRLCEADGKQALFHRWVEEDRALLKVNAFVRPNEIEVLRREFQDHRTVPPGCSTEVIRETFALVEFPDGSIGKVKPELITFLDKEVMK